MPNIENLARKSFTNNTHRGEIFHRKDLRDGFGYSLVGIAASLALAGAVYVIGKQLLK